MKDSYYDLIKSEPIIQNFQGVRVFSEICSATENHISIPVGVNDLIGIKILFRLSSEENGTVGTALTSSQVRYLTKSVNPVITSLQLRCGDLQFPDRPITSSVQLHNYLKEFHLVHHDADVGSLVNVWNFNNPATDTQMTLNTTDMHYLAFDLSKNGANTGIPAKQSNLEIDISCDAVSNLIADVFCIYSRSVITVGGETSTVLN